MATSFMQKVFVGLLVALASTGAQAQIKNTIVESPAQGVSASSAVALSLRNPTIAVAATAQAVYYSTDGGGTWQKSQITPLHPAGDQPSVACDSKGDFYYVHRSTTDNQDKLVCHVSRDGGKTWDGGTPVNETPAPRRLNPRVTVDEKENVYVTWTQYDGTDPCTSAVYLSRSSNGRKWGRPAQVSQNTGDCAGDDATVNGAMATIGVDDRMFVGWAGHNNLYMDRSFDKGSMWLSSDITILSQRGGWRSEISGLASCANVPYLLTDCSKEKFRACLYNVWADQRSGAQDTDIWFIRSVNFGDNWTSPLRVNDDDPGSQQYLPVATMDQTTGFIYIVYYDRREHEGDLTDLYIAFSDSGGAAFRNIKINDAPMSPVKEGIAPALSAHKNSIVCTWSGVYDGQVLVKSAVMKYSDLRDHK